MASQDSDSAENRSRRSRREDAEAFFLPIEPDRVPQLI